MTRQLLLHGNLDLHAPDDIWNEFERNRALLARRTKAAGLAGLEDALQRRIASIPLALIAPHLAEAERRVGPKLVLDAPYVAACLAREASLWSNDKELAKRAGVQVLSTQDVLGLTNADS